MPFSGFGQKRRGSDQSSEDDMDMQQFKECVEEAKSEFPQLSSYALHQKAVERYAKRHEHGLPEEDERRRRSSSEQINLFQGMFSRLRLGRSRRESGARDLEAGQCDGTASRKHSECFPTDDNTDEIKRRSIAPRKSVAIPTSAEAMLAHKNMLQNLFDECDSSDRSGNDSCSSLANSLAGIEQAWNVGGTGRRLSASSHGSRVRRASRRLSAASTDLTNVKEDEELEFEVMVLETMKEKRSVDESNTSLLSSGSSLPTNEMKKSVSFSELLPDEIKHMVKKNECENNGLGQGQAEEVSPMEDRERAPEIATTVRKSSMLSNSASSENFEGDFSAWRDSVRNLTHKKNSILEDEESTNSHTGREDGDKKYNVSAPPSERSSSPSSDKEELPKASNNKINKDTTNPLPGRERRGLFGLLGFRRRSSFGLDAPDIRTDSPPGSGEKPKKIPVSEENGTKSEEEESIDGNNRNSKTESANEEAPKCGMRRFNTHKTRGSGNTSSFSTVDSSNFVGDFSAWRTESFKMPAKIINENIALEDGEAEDTNENLATALKSLDRNGDKTGRMHDSVSTCLSINEENFEGDFSAWKKGFKSGSK